jgi:signal transduction histidine kinase
MENSIEVELLSDAFNTFRDASRKLEEQYAMLENRIEELSAELAEKNRAMERTRRLAAMGEMAAKIAHEIRNPLGSMAIFANLLERELASDEDKRKLAEHISKGIKTLDNLLSNMLLFASSPMARLKNVDLKEIIEETLVLTEGRGPANMRIRKEFDGRTCILGDQNLLRQLFLNLFINSLDALDDGGLLSIKTSLSEENHKFVEIRVRDNGKGIAQEHMDRIFDPFFSTKERGTGLGLAIVSAVVGAHNGFIDVVSEPGKGTSFLISLPVAGNQRKAS